MKTAIIKLSAKNWIKAVARAAQLIKSGQLVVFPTETVYGLGARVDDEKALKKIFKAKGRPSDNPIIVHIATLKQLPLLAHSPSLLEQKIIKKFWPGPLTIILKKKRRISGLISGGLPTIAIRMPSHSFARSLILKANVPIAAPSANLSGFPSGTRGAHALQDFIGKVPLVIDAGPSTFGLESTVVKVEKGKIFILRPGAVTKEILERATAARVVFSKKEKDLKSSPGARYRHYAPRARLEIFKNARVLKKRLVVLEKKNVKVGILKKRKLKEASKNLYHDLRKLDGRGVDVILSESYPERGLGVAIMDRLRRASMR